MKLVRDITSLLAALVALLEPFLRLVDTTLSNWTGHPLPALVSVSVCALLLVPLIFRVVLAIKSRTYPSVRNVGALDIAVGTGKNLPGRSDDLLHLVAELRVMPLVFMVGESGVGKSTLLRHGVFSDLQEDKVLLPLLVESRTWIDRPEETLTAIVQSALTRASGSSASPRTTIKFEFEDVTRALGNATGRVPTLLIDHFESYVDRHRTELLTPRTVWLSSEELQTKIPFWRKMARLIASHELRALIVIRSDYGDVVPTFQIALSRVFPVNRLERTVVTSRLNQLEDAQFVESARNPYWRDLREVIEGDFEQMGGYVLPIQLDLTLRGLPYLKPLTGRAYRRGGGVSGLEARVALTRVETAAAEHRVPVLVLLAALKRLYNPATAVSMPQSTEELRAVSPGVDPLTFHAAMDRLRDMKLLRLQTGTRADETRWSLAHSYLYYAVARAERQVLAKSLSLSERDRQRLQGVNFIERWKALLWPHEILAVLWGSIRGQNHADQHKALVCWSALKLGPFVALLMLPFLIADVSEAIPGHRTLRSWMDAAGISIFRHVYARQSVSEMVERDISVLAQALSGQRDDNGWYRTRFNKPVPLEKDYWAHAQVLAILSDRVVTSDEELLSLVDGLSLLYRDVVTDFAGKLAGWPRSSIAEVNYARAEPALWSGIAIARLLGQKDRLPTDRVAELEQLRAALEQICANYFVPETGGWNRFAAQIGTDAKISSTYVTTLALLMLLELREASTPFELGSQHRDLLISKTTKWLLRNAVPAQGRHAWRDNPLDDAEVMSESLSLQTYYVVRRSVLQNSSSLEKAGTWAEMVNYLRYSVRSEEPSEAIGHIQRTIRTLQGENTVTDATISFLYRPWVVAAAGQALRQDCYDTLGRIGTSDILQNAARTVMTQNVLELTSENQFLFPAAEWLLGLQQLRDALAHISKCT